MTKINGIEVSPGIAIAKAYYMEAPDLSFEKVTINNPVEEIERLNKALENSKQELEKIKIHTKENIDDEHADIFSAHLLVLSDPELITPMKDKIETDNVRAETALKEVSDMFIEMFENYG